MSAKKTARDRGGGMPLWFVRLRFVFGRGLGRGHSIGAMKSAP